MNVKKMMIQNHDDNENFVPGFLTIRADKKLWTRSDCMSLERLKTIGYITDMSRQMKVMAAELDSPFLALLLEMVAKEGQNILKDAGSKQENH